MRKGETGAPKIDSDGCVSGMDASQANFELSKDGKTNWHKPTSEEAELTEYDEYKLKAGYKGYGRFKETDYQEASEITYINYYGNINNILNNNGTIHLYKKWYGYESSASVTVELSYKIIAPRLAAPRRPGLRRMSPKGAPKTGDSITVKVSDTCSYTVTKLNGYGDYQINFRQVINKGSNWKADVKLPTIEEIRDATGWFVFNTGGTDFTITELDHNSDYVITGIIEDDGNFDITNIGVTNVPVKKVWDDEENKDGIRPDSVTVELYADGEPTGQAIKLSSDGGWEGAFVNLPAGRFENGAEKPTAIKYTVKEVATEGYTSKISGNAEDGFTITNTHESSTVTPPDNPQDPAGPDSKGNAVTTNGSQPQDASPLTVDTGNMGALIAALVAVCALSAAVVMIRRRRE